MAFESYGGLLDTPKSEGGLDVLAQDTELLWCGSPIDRYFCTTEISPPNLGIFLIPLTKRFLYAVGTNLLEG